MILRPYQEAGRDFLAARWRALLADEMRVGKTPQAILAAHKTGAQSVLVLCPAIAVPQWQAEFRKWWPGEILPRLQVLSYAKATSLWQRGESIPSDVFIPDEAHFAKNPEALRTKMVYGKKGFGAQAGAIWALSGTPAPKHAAELWPMLRAFGVVGMTYDEFIRRYCTVNVWTGRITGTKVAMIPELKGLLAEVMLRRTRAEVAPDMPRIAYEFVEIEPGEVDLPVDALTKLDWSDGCTEDRQVVAMAKAPALVEQIVFAIENGLLKQTVVFGWHIEPLEAVVAGLRQRGLSAALLNGSTSPRQRVEIQNSFRLGETHVVVANIATAGTAIDLSAASHGYFLELDWVPGNNVQAANRLVSMQNVKPVSFDILTRPGSTDDRVQQILIRRVKELSQLY